MAKRRLHMKPTRAPKWWPRDARGRVEWVGVLKDGDGWVVGDGDLMTAEQIRAARRLVVYEVSYKPRFEVR